MSDDTVTASPRRLHIAAIPGDGIGPEVTEAARQVIAAAGVEVIWDVQEAGADRKSVV